MNPETKRIIRKCDIYVGIIIFMVVSIHFMTNFFMMQRAEETGADIENVVAYYEMNPFLKIQLLSNRLFSTIFFLVEPGFVMAVYWLFRHRVKAGKAEPLVMQTFVMVMFFVGALNFLNDLGVVAGMLARGMI